MGKYILNRNLIPAEGALRHLLILNIEQGNDFDISLRIVGKERNLDQQGLTDLEDQFGVWVAEESEQCLDLNPFY